MTTPTEKNMGEVDKLIRIDPRTEAMDHSGGFDWDWLDTHDFVKYLIENKYICEFSVAAIPHDGSHGVCASCQADKIILKLKQYRKNYSYTTSVYGSVFHKSNFQITDVTEKKHHTSTLTSVSDIE